MPALRRQSVQVCSRSPVSVKGGEVSLPELRLLDELNAIQCSSDCEVPVREDRGGAGNVARGQCRAGNRHIYWTSPQVTANATMLQWARYVECCFRTAAGHDC